MLVHAESAASVSDASVRAMGRSDMLGLEGGGGAARVAATATLRPYSLPR